MSRLKRLNQPGLYYICLEGVGGLFVEQPDYQDFCAVLSEVHRKYRVRIYAFCLLPDAIYLVIEVRTVTASRFVQRLLGTYMLRVRHRGVHKHIHRRHVERLITADYLLASVRFVHFAPVRAGVAKKPSRHKWSSHVAYARRPMFRWMRTRTVLRKLSVKVEKARRKYRAMMRTPLPPRDALLFQRGSAHDARIVGGHGYLSDQPRRRRGESNGQL